MPSLIIFKNMLAHSPRKRKKEKKGGKDREKDFPYLMRSGK